MKTAWHKYPLPNGSGTQYSSFNGLFTPFTTATYDKATGKLSAQTYLSIGAPVAATTITITEDQLDAAFEAVELWAAAVLAMER